MNKRNFDRMNDAQKDNITRANKIKSFDIMELTVDEKALERFRKKPYETRDIYGKEK